MELSQTPRCPLPQKSQLVETVEGVNTPVLERMVQDNAPSKDELAASTDEPDSADEEDTTTGGGGGGAGKRRASLSVGLGRRRFVFSRTFPSTTAEGREYSACIFVFPCSVLVASIRSVAR